MKYENLTDESKSVIAGMIKFCVNYKYCLGMNEGIDNNDKKLPFIMELESFIRDGEKNDTKKMVF